MATIRTTYRYPVDLDKGTHEVTLRNPLMQSDALADEFRAVVNRGGSPVSVAGMTVYAYLYNQAEQMTIALGGSVSGNEASVVLDSECYKVPGWASLVIQLAEGDVRHTVLKVNLCITRTGTDTIFDPTGMVPTLQELLGQIAAMEQATAASHAKIAEVDEKTNAAIEAANQATGAANAAIAALGTDNAPAIVETKRADLVTITDGAARPAVEVLTHIEPVQEGSGDPSPDNVRPIKGWDKVTAARAVQNLIPMFTDNTTVTETWGYYSPRVTLDYHLPSNVPLSIRCFFTDGTELDTSGTVFLLRRADDTIVAESGFWGSKITLTAEDARDVEAYQLYFNDNGATKLYGKTIAHVQLTVGDVTGIVPYQGQTLSADLPETVYGGTLDWMTGVLTVNTRKIPLASLGWSGLDEKNRRATEVVGISDQINMDAMPIITCDVYPTIISMDLYNNTSLVGITQNRKHIMIRTADNAAPTSGEVVFQLEEPYTIQLPPQQLNVLKGVNNVWSDCGETTLSYIADTKMYIDQKLAAISAAVLGL